MNPYTIAAASPNSTSGEIAAEFKFRGPSATFSQGCTSGAMAISHAYNQIQLGKATLMLAGGTDTPFQESTFAAFCRTGMLANATKDSNIPPPLDKDSRGIILGEGAAIIVLEDLDHALTRGAHIYAEILSEANTCDGFDMIKSRWHGTGASRAIELALNDAGLHPKEISSIFAHATGATDNDNMELRAINKIFKTTSSEVPITNVKALIGYSQGACAAIELVAACLSLDFNFIPGQIGLKNSKRQINATSKVRHESLNNILVNCFGFGGKNQCIVIGKV